MSIKALALMVAAGLAAALPALALTHYVDVNSTNPIPPYTNWATAANVIQDAVDAAGDGDTVFVTDGVYDTGGRAVYGTMTNRVALDKPLTLTSLSGPENTFIRGRQVLGTTNGTGAVRCVYMTNGAVLAGFTLTNGATLSVGQQHFEHEICGGGVWCEPGPAPVVSNCVLVGNAAKSKGGGACWGELRDCVVSNNVAELGGGVLFSEMDGCNLLNNSAQFGGGAYYGTLVQCVLSHNSATVGGGSFDSWLDWCTLTANSADSDGGGAFSTTLNNCIVMGNSAGMRGGGAYGGTLRNVTLVNNTAGDEGGGCWGCTLHNCISFYNNASVGPNYWNENAWYSCVLPESSTGQGNLTNAPLFLDTNGWSNLRLQPTSPCINRGYSGFAMGSTDLEGAPRVVGGAVDMGAYESLDGNTTNGVPWRWLLQYGLPTDGSIDDIDGDGDKATTWQEWKMWTDPTNQLSVLEMLHADPQTNATLVTWQSVKDHSYSLERATNPAASFAVLQSNIVGQAETTTFTDTTATNEQAVLYRVSVPE